MGDKTKHKTRQNQYLFLNNYKMGIIQNISLTVDSLCVKSIYPVSPYISSLFFTGKLFVLSKNMVNLVNTVEIIIHAVTR